MVVIMYVLIPYSNRTSAVRMKFSPTRTTQTEVSKASTTPMHTYRYLFHLANCGISLSCRLSFCVYFK